MSTGVSTRQKLVCKLDDIDGLLRDLLDRVNKKSKFEDFQHLIVLLLEKDKEVKSTLKDVEEQLKIQKKIDQLRADCMSSDIQIQSCQKKLQQSELILSTALYYCRQKLDSMVSAVKNPIDVEELIKFSHRISHTYGAIAPDNWIQGDPRRPYPNKEEIRSGYLGFLDDFGNFRPEINEALAQAMPPCADNAVLSSTTTYSQLGPGGQAPLSTSGQYDTQSVYTLVPSNSENSAVPSSSMILPGVNMVSSPSIANAPVASGSSIPGVGSFDSTPSSGNIGQQPIASQSRHPTSLAAMLTGQVTTCKPVGQQPPPLPRSHAMSQPFPRMSSMRTPEAATSPVAGTDIRPYPSQIGRALPSHQNPFPPGLLPDSQRFTHRKRHHQVPGSSVNESLDRSQSSSYDLSAEEFQTSRTDNLNF